MNRQAQLLVFGEVLFDCFPDGECVRGGAPFNVAWHLNFLGNNPQFISRVGNDELGRNILDTMNRHGMSTQWLQRDQEHPTGVVKVSIIDNEPAYEIRKESAYDFIAVEQLPPAPLEGILYHGTLGLRHPVSRGSFRHLHRDNPELSVFLDVNLRSPWWRKDEVFQLLEEARWCKLNQHELARLGYDSSDFKAEMASFHARFGLDHLILTQGSAGAVVLTREGSFHMVCPEKPPALVDTVGAGDAFSAIYIHGLLAGWPLDETLHQAQQFASRIIGIRGATTAEATFYQPFQQ